MLFLIFLLSSCSQEGLAPWNGPELNQTRDQLTVQDLQQNRFLPLADMSNFAKPEWASEAVHRFSGTITIDDARMIFPKERDAYVGEDRFPAITMAFFTHEGNLIPVSRERIIVRQDDNDVYWDVILGAGEVWQEEGDGEWSRASFPLSLTDWYIGQVRNCVGTFVFQAEVMSNVYVQCSQETADLNDQQVGDIRTMLQVEYDPMIFDNADEVIQQHAQAKSNRLPVFPLSDIDTDNEIADYFNKSLSTNASTSLGAVLVNGELYLHPPNTRHGLYPYPNEMRHGVYSVTKSMAGALSLLYLAERYGEEIFDALITEYVPALADHPAWQGVTFGHTLNMATGTEGSERAEHLLNIIILAKTAEEAINNVATLGDYPEAPGEKFNYASTNIFVLSYALQSYVEEKEGPGVYYWDLVHENVLMPIGAEHLTVLHTLESDGSQGIPFLAYGAAPTLDEAAKIAMLFSNEGNFDGQHLLNQAKTQEALGRTDWAGYSTDERGVSYRHSFRSTSFRTSIRCPVEVSYMLGFGANHVLFLPSDVVVIRFMDEYDFEIDDLVRRVEGQIPICS